MGDKSAWKTIGILGGMGPEATAEFYRRIISICQKDYGAKYDSDFPSIFIYNLPLPDIVYNAVETDCIISLLKDGIGKLKYVGCDLIAVPCNTVFYFIYCIADDIPLLNIMEETFVEANRRNYSKVGVLSTLNTARNKLYENVFGGIEILQPSETEREEVNEIIIRILSGAKLNKDREYLISVINRLEKSGAEAIILGCTELPLLVSQKDCDVMLLDTLQILAKATIERACFPTKSLSRISASGAERR